MPSSPRRAVLALGAILLLLGALPVSALPAATTLPHAGGLPDTCLLNAGPALAPARGSVPVNGSAVLAGTNLDSAAAHNLGFTLNLTQFPLPPPQGSSTFLVSDQELVGDDLLSMGVIANNQLTGPYPRPFWAVADNATGALLSCGFAATSPLTGAAIHLEAFSQGNDDWTVDLDGQPFDGSANVSLPAAQASSTGSISVGATAIWNETAPWLPAQVNLTQAIRVLIPGSGWVLPYPFVADWAGPGDPLWGIAGNLQLPLPPGELVLGTDVAPANGTLLWDTPAPTEATVTTDPSSLTVVSQGQGNLTAAIVSDGQGLPGVNLTCTLQAITGTCTTQGASNASGDVRVHFLAPRVTSSETGTLVLSVNGTEFQGEDDVVVTIQPLPPTPVALTVTLNTDQARAGAIVAVQVMATSDGAPAAGLTVIASASLGGGEFAPFLPWTTNAQGMAFGNYTTPGTGGSDAITLAVNTTGYSGSGTGQLTVIGPASPTGGTSSSALPLEVGGVLLVVALVLTALVLRRRRIHAGADTETVPASAAAGEGPAAASPPSKAGPDCPACGEPLGSEDLRFCPKCSAPVRPRDGSPS